MPAMEYLVTMSTHVPEGTPDEAVAEVRGPEFLTTFVIAVPEGTPGRAVEDAGAREAQRAKELAGQGHLRRLWALPGLSRTLGLWQAADPAEMLAILRSLPLDPWMTVQTTPLTPHPSDPAQTS
jgi:muconolactone delta-isomerase